MWSPRCAVKISRLRSERGDRAPHPGRLHELVLGVASGTPALRHHGIPPRARRRFALTRKHESPRASPSQRRARRVHNTCDRKEFWAETARSSGPRLCAVPELSGRTGAASTLRRDSTTLDLAPRDGEGAFSSRGESRGGARGRPRLRQCRPYSRRSSGLARWTRFGNNRGDTTDVRSTRSSNRWLLTRRSGSRVARRPYSRRRLGFREQLKDVMAIVIRARFRARADRAARRAISGGRRQHW